MSDHTNIPSSANSPLSPAIFPSAVFSTSLGYQSRVLPPQSDPRKQPVQQRKKILLLSIITPLLLVITTSHYQAFQDTTTIYSEQPLDNHVIQCFRKEIFYLRSCNKNIIFIFLKFLQICEKTFYSIIKKLMMIPPL